MKKSKGARSSPGTKSGRCPYCGSAVVFRSADGIYKENSAGTMLFVCSKYPGCDAYVRATPGTKTPIGVMANGPLRALRNEAHQHFDRLHLAGIMTRKQAYEWLACILQAPLSQAHIGNLTDYYCRQVIEESKKLLENQKRVHGARLQGPQRRTGGGAAHANI